MSEREDLLPGFIPTSLIEEGVIFNFSMARLRPRNIAWRKEAAIEVITTLAEHGYAILGGDVLELCGEQLAYTGVYWDLPDEDVVLWEEYVEDTRERSICFIEETARRKGESFLCTIFFINEREYKEQMRNFGSIEYR